MIESEIIKEPEIWKPVSGYEGLYEISSYGQLKRLGGYTPRIRNGYKSDEIYHGEIILKSGINKKGYVVNDLYHHNGKKHIRKSILIHRLVAQEFIDEQPIDKPQVNHKNGIKNDNYYKNLEWCNNQENQIHARQTGLLINKKSWEHIMSKPVKSINIIDGSTTIFGSISEAYRETGIPTTNICKVLKGKRNKAGGYYWEYLNDIDVMQK